MQKQKFNGTRNLLQKKYYRFLFEVQVTTPKKYRITNWSEYNQALIHRGSITFWFNTEAIEAWYEKSLPQKRGSPQEYSDMAIQTALTLKSIFHLTLRSTQGFLQSLIQLMDISINIPNYSTLCRRQKNLKILIPTSSPSKPLHIAVDSTGLKVFGEGEWKVRIHGKQKKRTWRKLHLAMDVESYEIKAMVASTNNISDSQAFPYLIEQIPDPIDQVTGDGGYDRFKCYEKIEERGGKAIIPPQKGCRIKQHKIRYKKGLGRDENIREIRKYGRKKWKKKSNYHKRSLIETEMFRYKTIFGDRLQSRRVESQLVEMAIKCRALNYMTALGMPQSICIS